MSNIMMTRGVMEAYNDRGQVAARRPDLRNLTLMGRRLILETDSGKRISMAEYRMERQCNPTFAGFTAFLALDNEDALLYLKIQAIRLKHRVAIVSPSRDADFTLCVINFCLECLPLTRTTLIMLIAYLHNLRPRVPIFQVMKETCLRLVHSSLYLFFDIGCENTMRYIPQTYVLYKEARRSGADVVSQTVFLVDGVEGLRIADLNFASRHTRDGVAAMGVLTSVLDDTRGCLHPLQDSTLARVQSAALELPSASSDPSPRTQ